MTSITFQTTSPALSLPAIGKWQWLTVSSIVASDAAALALAYWTAVLIRYAVSPDYALTFYLRCFPIIASCLIVFLARGLYPGCLIHPAEEIRRVSLSVTMVFLLFAAATYLFHDTESYSRSAFLLAWTFAIPAVLLGRAWVRHLCSRASWWGIPAVVIGSGESAAQIVQILDENRKLGVRVVGYVGNESGTFSGTAMPCSFLGELSTAPFLAAKRHARYAIVAMPEVNGPELKYIVQHYCRGFRHILLVPEEVSPCSLGVEVKDIGGNLGLEVPQNLFHKSSQWLKRATDLTFSVVGLILSSPVLIACAVAVKTSSPGPILFGHKRHGELGKIFKSWKFRTMVTDGDSVLARYFESHPEERQYWQKEHKLKNDPRITRVGRFLRRASLDELPQLWNVLTGAMSVVGPRPIVPNEINTYGEKFDLCTSVRPGITGLWQVSGRNNLTFSDRIRFNEYYIRNWSIWLDIFILVRTINTVLRCDGAY